MKSGVSLRCARSVRTGAYVSLPAHEKTDYTACYPGKNTTYILHVVPITTHTHVRTKSIGKKKQRKEKNEEKGKERDGKERKGKERKKKERKRKRKAKTRQEEKRQKEEAMKEKGKKRHTVNSRP